MTIRFPSRPTPVTSRPTTSVSGGSAERRTDGGASRTRGRRGPTTRSRRASTYTVTSGSSGTAPASSHGYNDRPMTPPRPGMTPAPPVARRVPHVTEIHGDRLVDPYHWLREKDNSEVTAYLQAENAYTDAAL